MVTAMKHRIVHNIYICRLKESEEMDGKQNESIESSIHPPT